MFFCKQSYSQDIHFSQPLFAPAMLNPAHTGGYKGDWRISNIHRRQWGAISIPWITSGMMYDRQFYLDKDRFSGGLFLVNDKSGTAELNANNFGFSGAYHKRIAENYFSFGVNIGLLNKSISWHNIRFGDQWNDASGRFDNQMSTQESFEKSSITSFNFDWGISWKRSFESFSVQASYATFHLNKPRESFLNSDNRMYSRHTAFLSGKYHLSEDFFIEPELMYSYDIKASELLSGLHFGTVLPEKPYSLEELFLAVKMRNGFNRSFDAVIVAIGARSNKVQAIVSYDMNVSGLRKAGKYNGAIEIGLIYIATSTWIEKYTVPCDRY